MEILVSINSKTDGTVREARSELGERLLIGRGAEDGIILEGPDLSREHLMLTAEGTNIFVVDLSANGTWLNGTRLRKSAKTRIQPEDTIEVPGYALTVKVLEQIQESRIAPSAMQGQAAGSQDHHFGNAVQPPHAAGMLAPVSQFLESFTFGEKFLVVVSFGGLLLLYAYAAS